jgi:hypothetical protein
LGERYIGIELEDYLEIHRFIGGSLADFDLRGEPPEDTLGWPVVADWYDTKGEVRLKGRQVTFVRTVFTSSTNDDKVITTISGTITCP